ncbi:MAG: ABC transporter ATP-binding protein [Lactobacillales bacterium]|jgi:ABC-2 type transport system ATP-binding protein|nr:ABC transporter ATP-binding protein [Lactobacillales bacterium]
MGKANSENILEIVNLTKKYDNFCLNSINFSIKKGTVTGFIGINGAGKTTTIKSIAGLVIPNSGEIHIFGEAMNSKNEGILRDRMGFLLDGEYFYPDLSVKKQAEIFSHGYSSWDQEKFNAFTDRFYLPLKQKLKELSRGMKMKFSLALALSHHAELLIMDEPTSGLDPLVREEFLTIIKDLAKEGVSVLFSSHITSDLEKIADNIIFIHKGEIILNEDIHTLKSSYFTVIGDAELNNDEHRKIFLKVTESNGEVRGILKREESFVKEKFERFGVLHSTIEEIMLATISGGTDL